MATGPEHYTEAERLLGAVDDWDSTDPKHHPIIAEFIAQAQVHATLALAAQNVPPPVIVHVEGDVKPEQLRRLINEANREAVQRHPGVAQ